MKRPRKLHLGILLVVAAGVAVTAALATSFQNGGLITINDLSTATPYPSQIAVSGLVGPITDVNVTLKSFRHSAPDDVDVLVTSPGGGKVVLMSDAGDLSAVSPGIDLTFDDDATISLPDESHIDPNTYKPTNYGTSGPGESGCEGEALDENGFPGAAPSAPYSSTLAAFNTQPPNGTWNLWVDDDCLDGTGFFDNGWSVDIQTNPTGVAVARLTSRPVPSGVSVRWTTSAETEIAGFNVYKGLAKLNKRLVSARHPGSARSATYTVIDRAVREGGTYTYRLQVVGLDGKKAWFGATSIRLAS